MKAHLFILFFVILIFVEPILAELAVDEGPSWSYGKHYSCGLDDTSGFCKELKWLVLSDDSYRLGNYNEAVGLARYFYPPKAKF